jgi:hypothetical protein
MAVALIAGPGGGEVPGGRAADRNGDHPALAPFGVDVAELPAELYLVRSRGDLPSVAGVKVHGVLDGVYLVSGNRESVMSLARAQCAVFPIEGLPAEARSAPRVWTTVTSPDPTIQLMVAQVNWFGISTKIQWLVDYGTRYSYADNHEDVADGIAAVFDDIGMTPVKRSFVYDGATMWNVEATQLGTVYPDSFIIMCGHFDSISWVYPFRSAPGADDNGTGTAAVLHAAEILRSHDFQYSIRYICFGGEEQSLRGSQAYAQWAADSSLGIVGVLNFDMIGYWRPGVEKDLEIETNQASQWLAAAIVNAADLYVGAPYELHVFDGAWWGDHASFWTHGYAAVNHEESWDWGDPDFNPNYHTTHDFLEYVDEDFMVGNVKIGVASVATLARLDPPVAVLIESFEARLVNASVQLAWDITTDEEIRGFKIYRTTDGSEGNEIIGPDGLIPPGSKMVIDEAVQGGKTYRYTLTVVRDDHSEVRSQTATVKTRVHKLALHQNYPNPFNPSTKISFALPGKVFVNLSIYDITGRRVKTLVHTPLGEGLKEITWHGIDARGNPVSSGVYFYRLTAGKRTLTKKMILLK